MIFILYAVYKKHDDDKTGDQTKENVQLPFLENVALAFQKGMSSTVQPCSISRIAQFWKCLPGRC